MKMLKLMCIILLITIGVKAQTEDGYLRVQYLGKVGTTYKVQVTNKQSCDADLVIQYTGSPQVGIAFKHIAGNAIVVYDIANGPYTEIKVKVLTICHFSGVPQWLILDNHILPVKIKAIRITIIKD